MARPLPVRPRRQLKAARGETKRLEILLPATDVEAVLAVADLTGHSTVTAVVRDALKAYAWLVLEQRRNRAIIAEDRVSGVRTELMPLLKVTAHIFAEVS